MKRALRKYLALAYHLYRDRRTPFIAKALLWIAFLYVVWPIDLIPDFIPVLGQLDDLVVLVFCLLFAMWLVPPELYDEHYRRIFGIVHH